MVFSRNASLEEKLRILSDAAKYDVACTSSGVERAGTPGSIGNTQASGICHSFSADGRCISLLKILFTNECIYNCKYCINRVTNDVPRATFTPEEVCQLTMEFYRRNYIEGLFLSSGIIDSPDYTMELICQTVYQLRTVHRFCGYIHCKAIPGASPELVELLGWYTDRMSINMELPTAEGLRRLAPNKTRKNILTPMRQVQNGIAESQELLGMKGGNHSAYWYTSKRMGRQLPGSDRKVGKGEGHVLSQRGKADDGENLKMMPAQKGKMSDREEFGPIPTQKEAVSVREDSAVLPEVVSQEKALVQMKHCDTSRGYVPAGQSTQMIIGASGESDYEIVSVAEALYQKFDLKRVFYSAFINVNQDSSLPALDGKPPLKREHRLYQADFLMRYYGYQASELLTASHPNFNVFLDPKCDWALGHLEQFPVEVCTADYNTLLRVPGIGVKSARRLVKARRTGQVDYQALKKMGVVLKRAVYFITCHGRMMYDFLKIDEDYITRHLLGEESELQKYYEQDSLQYQQLSLFDVRLAAHVSNG